MNSEPSLRNWDFGSVKSAQPRFEASRNQPACTADAYTLSTKPETKEVDVKTNVFWPLPRLGELINNSSRPVPEGNQESILSHSIPFDKVLM